VLLLVIGRAVVVNDFSSKLVEFLARTVKVDFCLLLRETMPSQRADVWAKANMEAGELA